MTSLTPMKSDCTIALEKCIVDCQRFVQAHKSTSGMEKCIELCQLCIGACADCLAACEAARLDRGKMMYACVDACHKCVLECEKHNNEYCQRCVDSCNNCIEELRLVMA